MKREYLERMKDLIVILLNHLLFIAGVITFLDLFQVERMMLPVWVGMICIPLLLYYIKPRTQKLLPPPLTIALLTIFSVIEKIMTDRDMGIYYYMIVFLYLALFFLYFFVKRYQEFISFNGSCSVKIPEKKIFYNGFRLTCMFVSASLFVLVMSCNMDWFEKVIDWIWKWIWMGLRMLVSQIETQPPGVQRVPPVEFHDAPYENSDVVDAGLLSEQAKEIIRAVMIGLFFVVFILGFLILVVTVYQLLKGRVLLDSKKWKDVALKNNDDIREHCGIEKKVQKKAVAFSFWNHREKIRKIYQKKMVKEKNKLVGEQEQSRLEYLTAKECCDKLQEQNLKLAYEKARYSAQDVTAEDVRWAKRP